MQGVTKVIKVRHTWHEYCWRSHIRQEMKEHCRRTKERQTCLTDVRQ